MLQEYFINKHYLNKTPLCDIMSKYGSDKGRLGSYHNYTTLYHYLFKDMRDQPLNIIEIGMASIDTTVAANMAGYGVPGGSIRGWKEYFSNSQIFGADIDTKTLFDEERIKTFYCDQTNESVVKEMLNNEILKNVDFDIIIDDGLHELASTNLPFLEIMIKKLKKGGYYIIEDILHRLHGQCAKKYIEQYKTSYNYIDYIQIPLSENGGDNNIILIKK
jgi:hypothetical protein